MLLPIWVLAPTKFWSWTGPEVFRGMAVGDFDAFVGTTHVFTCEGGVVIKTPGGSALLPYEEVPVVMWCVKAAHQRGAPSPPKSLNSAGPS